jgi:CRAL/TRIO domain
MSGNNNNDNDNDTDDQVMDEAVASALIEQVAALIAAIPVLDSTMFLSHAEHALAVAIRRAVEADDRLINLTDMEYGQYALTCADESMECICERVYTMQAFRREYGILDTVDDGTHLFHEFTLQHPGVILTVDYLHSTQNYIVVRDLAAWYPKRAKTLTEVRIMMGGEYYLFQCRNAHFMAIRNGMTSMNECRDATMENISFEGMERILHELIRPYPKNQRETFFLNSPECCNLLYGLLKRFLPEKITKSFQMGHQIQGMEYQRIDGLYKTPTPEIARQKVVLRVYDILQLRHRNQKTFSLENCVTF